MDDRFINSEPTDTLFPSVSARTYTESSRWKVSPIYSRSSLGSGPDTIYAAPNATATYSIQAKQSHNVAR